MRSPLQLQPLQNARKRGVTSDHPECAADGASIDLNTLIYSLVFSSGLESRDSFIVSFPNVCSRLHEAELKRPVGQVSRPASRSSRRAFPCRYAYSCDHARNCGEISSWAFSNLRNRAIGIDSVYFVRPEVMRSRWTLFMLKPARGAESLIRCRSRADGLAVVLHVSHSMSALTQAFSRLAVNCFAIPSTSLSSPCVSAVCQMFRKTRRIRLSFPALLISQLINGLASIANVKLSSFSASGAHWGR